MDEMQLLIDLHLRNDRQGPGSEAETRRAIELARLDRGRRLEIADIGCGTGASSLVLAQALDCRVAAVDASEAFVDRLGERARAAGLGGRINASVGLMESLGFEAGRFDAVWSEGAIYNMGFGAGVRAWREFLKPGGVLAVTELSWTTAERPKEIDAHWTSEYPGIGMISENLGEVMAAGYQPLGVFVLPPECWEERYYAPMRAGFESYLERHEQSEAARRIVEAEEREMQLFSQYGAYYGYVFYIARRVGG